MANKDFLGSLTEDKKPDSFKEEERVKVEKPKKHIPAGVFVGAAVALVVAAIVFVWVVLIPHIKFNDFTNRPKEEVQAYLVQNKIDTQGIVFLEEYNFNIEKGNIISQSISGDSKIKKSTKITFVVSKGADPEETVKVPDLESMTKSEASKWIEDNKLTAAKISTAYSDEVAEGNLISVSFKNDDRDNFKRNSQVTLTFSKGAQPANTLKVIDLKEQPYSAAEAFVKEKKLQIKKVESLSSTVEKGLIISTSPAANQNIKEGETLTVYVSKGKSVTLPDLVGKSVDDYNVFKLGDGKDVTTYEKYVNTTDKSLNNKIKEQTPAAGTKVTDEVFVVTIYKYEAPEKETEKVTIPNLVGKTEDDYNIFKLGDGKFVTTYIKDETTDDYKLDGIIKEQSIKPDTKITDEVFVVTIYRYKQEIKPVTLPTFTNEEQFDNWMLVYGVNLTPKKEYEETTDSNKVGTVISQYPESGTEVTNETIIVKFYKGVDTSIELPDFRGKRLTDIEQFETSKNIKLVIYTTEETAPEAELVETIKEQSLPVGTRVNNGDRIDLIIWK